jgi:hypothetical protein
VARTPAFTSNPRIAASQHKGPILAHLGLSAEVPQPDPPLPPPAYATGDTADVVA